MYESKVELQCEKCEKEFEIFARNYEKVVQEDQPILCTDCFNEMMNRQNQENLPGRRVFEYVIAPIGEWSETETDNETIAYKLYGQEGWELVTIKNNKAYFKREIVKGL